MTVIEKLDMNVKQANSDFVAIKNKIVEKGVEVAEGTKTAEYADKIGEVYEAGKKAEYDEFWDAYQNYGVVKDYTYSFYGSSWNDTVYKPKYALRVNAAYSTFSYTGITNIPLIIFDETCTAADNTFTWLRSTHTIGKMVVHENLKFYSTFYQATALEKLTIEGVIGQNGLNLQWSTKLSKASIESVVNALSSHTDMLSITLSLTAVNKAFETSSGANDGSTSDEWVYLTQPKQGWTINLV